MGSRPWPVPVNLLAEEETPAEQRGDHRGPGTGRRPPPGRKRRVLHVSVTAGGEAYEASPGEKDERDPGQRPGGTSRAGPRLPQPLSCIPTPPRN